MSDRFTIRFMTCMLLTFVFYSCSFNAQSLPATATLPESSTQEPQVPNLDEKLPQLPNHNDDLFSKHFAQELLKDQVRIWTSPARIKASDAKWLVPLAAGTGLLFTQDTKISHH